MPGMQFEFDETGGSFYYFLVSFYFLILLPLTYFFWPKYDGQDYQELNKRKCCCDPCLSKQHLVNATSPNKGRRTKIIQGAFVFAWIVFLILAYKVSQIEMEWNEFDPFSVLGVSKDAPAVEIRRTYKMLSLKYHPDRGGDPERFMRLRRAYLALTNEQSRKNWQEHGNPDGPGATQFGIALPKWIVEKKNSIWVLGVYVFVFMVLLPSVVGLWWYRTIKFNSDKILINTTQLYFYFFNKTQNMPLKRVIMILSSSFEFKRSNNSEIIERPSDNEELPILVKHFPQINMKIKERPFATAYSVKARLLIYGHLHRFNLPLQTLYYDKNIIIKKCPYLINEMVNIVAQLVVMAHQGTGVNAPRLETIEYCMKLSQLIVQALTENQSPMMQLPHITEDILRHFVTRKHNIRSIRQLVEMKDEDRRNLLRTLSDNQYRDLMTVCANMPLVTMTSKCEVRDEEDSSITPSSLVTVTVKLTRKPLGSLLPSDSIVNLSSTKSYNNGNNNPYFLSSSQTLPLINVDKNDNNLYSSMKLPNTLPINVDGDDMAEESDECKGVTDTVANEKEISPPKKKPVWEKNRNKKKSNKNKSRKGKTVNQSRQNGKIMNNQTQQDDKSKLQQLPTNEDENGNSDNESDNGNRIVDNINNEEEDEQSGEEDGQSYNGDNGNMKFDGEEKWKSFQDEARKENSLETKARTTHQVHCPYFPTEKYEWWWLYLADRKAHGLSSVPLQICSLQDTEELQLKFTAPNTPGQYVYTVVLRSDSYLDFDQTQTIKITVKEAKPVDYKVQWNISDDEKSESDESDEDADYTDDDDKKEKRKAIKSHKGGNKKSEKENHNRDDLSDSDNNDSDRFSSNTDYDYDD